MSMEPEVLFDKLASMEHFNDIAEYCKSVKIRGDTGNDTDCVLARLFRRDCGVKAIRVTADGIEWSKKNEAEDESMWEWWETSGWGEQRKMTSALEVFVHEFDQHRYPELEDEIEDYE